MTPTIISFYTPDWEYPKYAQNLKDDCVRLNLPHHIVEKQSMGDYKLNCGMKPGFILECLEEFKKPVFWMDVDGSLFQFPSALSTIHDNYDVAFNWASAGEKRRTVGSMYFNYTESCIDFLKDWQTKASAVIDHVAFDHTIIKHSNLRIFEMPQEWVGFLYKSNSKIDPTSCFVHRVSRSPLKSQFKHSRRRNGK